MHFDKCLIDDGDAGFGVVFGVFKGSPLQHSGAHGGEVCRAHIALGSVVVFTVPGAADDAEPGGIAPMRDRDVGRHSNRFYSGKLLQLADDVAFERDGFRIIGISRVGCSDVHSGQMVGGQTEVDLQQQGKAAAQETGAHEEHDGGGEFENDQLRADATPCLAGRAASAPRPGRITHDRRSETPERGSEREQESGGGRG